MAGLMDIIGRENSTEKGIAETTMLCLKEMKKQSTENVEMVKRINSLVESSIKKIREFEAVLEENQANEQNPEAAEEYLEKIEQLKVEFQEKMDILKYEVEDFVHKENVKCYKNIKGILDEKEETQQKELKSIKRVMKVFIWFLFLITVLFIVEIIGVI